MNRIVVNSTIDGEGVLHLDLVVGKAQANKPVQVTVEPAPSNSMTPEEWRQFILSTAGKWQGDFERPEQGEVEERDPMS